MSAQIPSVRGRLFWSHPGQWLRDQSNAQKLAFESPAMSKGETNVKVVVRIRPESGVNESASTNAERIVVRTIDDQIVVFDPVDDDDDFVLAASRPTSRTELHKRGVKKTHRDTRFAFDRVFDENATQGDVYEATTRGIVDRVLDGINCSVFAYGATGAGKTHTMLGSQSDPGVVYRTMIELFETIEQRRDQAIFNVVVTYAEVCEILFVRGE